MLSVFRLVKGVYASDLSGNGAKLFGGRWNDPGVALVYTAESAALALAETIVHVAAEALSDLWYMMELEVDAPAKTIDTLAKPTVGWNEIPPTDASTKVGKTLMEKNLLGLWVPSAVVPANRNLLLNPGHQHYAFVRVKSKSHFPIDPRLIRVK